MSSENVKNDRILIKKSNFGHFSRAVNSKNVKNDRILIKNDPTKKAIMVIFDALWAEKTKKR